MRVTISGLLLSCVALAELSASTSCLKVTWTVPPQPGANLPEPVRQPQDCRTLLDLVLVVDASGSISPAHFKDVVASLLGLIRSLPISAEGVHVALIVFSTTVHVEWSFKDKEASNASAASEKVRRLKQPGGRTNTAKALGKAADLFLKGDSGARFNAPKVVVLLTDGESNDPPKTSEKAKHLRTHGANVVVLGVGSHVNHSECKVIAGCKHDAPRCDMYMESGWEDLSSSLQSLLKVVCKELPRDAVCGPWTPWSQCSVSCGEGTQISYRVEITPPVAGTPPCPTCPAPLGRSCAENGGVIKTQNCNERECDVDAGCGDWGTWSPWSATCGNATRTRKRTPYNTPLPTGNGKLCDQQTPPKPESESETKDFGSCGGDGGPESVNSHQDVHPHVPDDGSNGDGGDGGSSSPSEESPGGGDGSGGRGSDGAKDSTFSDEGEGRGTGPEEGQEQGDSGEGGGHHHQQESGTEEERPSKKESGGLPAAAIAGGVVGALFLAGGGAGAAYYYSKGGGNSAKAQPPVQYDDVADTKEVAEEEKETMITIGDESNMWADR